MVGKNAFNFIVPNRIIDATMIRKKINPEMIKG